VKNTRYKALETANEDSDPITPNHSHARLPGQESLRHASAVNEEQNSPLRWSWAMDENLCFVAVDNKYGVYEKEPKWFIGKTRTDVLLDYYGATRIEDIDHPGFDLVAYQNHMAALGRHEPFNNFVYCRRIEGATRWQCVSGTPLFDEETGKFLGYRGIGTDITYQRDAINQFSLYTRVIENASEGYAVYSADRQLLFCNDALRELLGISMQDSSSCSSLESLFVTLNERKLVDFESRLGETWLSLCLETAALDKSVSEWQTIQGRWLKVRSEKASDGTLIVRLDDISHYKKAQADIEYKHNLLRSVIDSIPDLIYVRDENLNYIAANRHFVESIGYNSVDEILGKVTVVNDIDQKAIDIIKKEEQSVIDTGIPIKNKEVVRKHAGTNQLNTYHMSRYQLRDDTGKILGMIGYGRDQTELVSLTDQLIYHAEHDALTGLLNRRIFDLRLEAALAQFQRNGQNSVIGFIDLDQFKIVNDTVGHSAGDELLKQVSQIIGRFLRKSDTYARLGGDEFGLIFHNTGLSDVERKFPLIIDAIREHRFTWGDKFFEIGASIGIVQLSEDFESVETICSAADMACYTAKDLGRGQYHIYTHHDATSQKRRNEIERAADIRAALESDRFTLYAQPIAKVEAGTDASSLPVDHYEILVRMLSEDGKIIPPDVFIPAAERFQLMDAVDLWVIDHAFAALAELIAIRAEDEVEHLPSFAINLSGVSLNNPDLPKYVKSKITEYQLPASSLCFEITETAFVTQLSLAQTFLEQLREIGCKFSLDDFGSGLSSFSYLKHFRIDYLKIDGGFVRDMVKDPTDLAMVRAIHSVGQSLGLKTIAEFVETEEHLDKLAEIGTDYVQGFAIARPEPLVNLLKEAVA